MQHSLTEYSRTLKAVAFGGLPTITTPARRCRQPFESIVLGILVAGLLGGCTRGVDDRINAAYAMARHPSPRNLDRIEALLNDEDRDVRATALVVMDPIDKVRSKRMATAALQDPDGLVRAAAVSVAAGGGDPSQLPALLALAVDDPVWQVRTRALDALAAYDDPSVREVFAEGLIDSVRHVRKAALLAGIKRPGLLPVDRLSDLVVSDPDWENRADAARALGASNDPAARPALEAALADPNEFVRAVASRERRGLPFEVAPPVSQTP